MSLGESAAYTRSQNQRDIKGVKAFGEHTDTVAARSPSNLDARGAGLFFANKGADLPSFVEPLVDAAERATATAAPIVRP